MSVPGASNTVLEVTVPYSRMSMIQLLGKVFPLFPSPFSWICIMYVLMLINFVLSFSCLYLIRFLDSSVVVKLLSKWPYWLTIVLLSSLNQVFPLTLLFHLWFCYVFIIVLFKILILIQEFKIFGQDYFLMIKFVYLHGLESWIFKGACY